LQTVLQNDPTNSAAYFFKSVVDFLAFVKQTSGDAGGVPGRFNDLFTRAGFVNVNANQNFWTWELQETDHGEGQIKDSTPLVEEFADFYLQDVKQQLIDLVDDLAKTPVAFEYAIQVEDMGVIPDNDYTDDNMVTFWIDYGDIMMMKAGIEVLLAKGELVCAYDRDGMDPNAFDMEDDPNVDGLDLIENTYTNFMKLLPPYNLYTARDWVAAAWDSYKLCSQHVRSETPEQEDFGILTLGRVTFDSQQERQLFVDREANFRQLAQDIVNHFYISQDMTITHNLDNDPIPPEEQVTINPYNLWEGIDIRDTFLATVVEPFKGKKIIGVDDITKLTPDMMTCEGVLKMIGGRVPNAGDLQEDEGFFEMWPKYAVVVDTPVHTMTVDGDGSEWTGNSVLIGMAPSASTQHDLGNVFVARDSTYLYIWIDHDLTQYSIPYKYDWLAIKIESGPSRAELIYWSPYGWYLNPSTILIGNVGNGIEIGIPIASCIEDHVEITIEMETDNGIYSIDSCRSMMYARIR
jgi:hypothetical protein